MISRRNFFRKLIGAAGIAASIPTVTGCHANTTIPGSIVGANAARGHMLRSMKFQPPKEIRKTDFVVVGGGIAGLSAARFLKKYTSEFLLLEMAETLGGNSIAGSNPVSAHPWGAHYLPLPGNGDPELVEFLTSSGVITGVSNGLPIYNDYYLCHDPKERLYINNHWQDGLIPRDGVPQKEIQEIDRFLRLMEFYRHATGSDQKKAFAIPVELSSKDKVFAALDQITANEFLRQNNFNSTYLQWYVNYCCADDFGTSTSELSAWVMIHYFASRTGKAANAPSDAVLTWPEGNMWLANQLKSTTELNIKADAMVYNVSMHQDKVEVMYWDAATNASVAVHAKAVIMATPQFITARLLHGVNRQLNYELFEYSPWMVANITTDHSLNERRGEPLCWDNVIYGSDALGYINANHQEVSISKAEKVITYYKPLLGNSTLERRKALERKFDDWTTLVLSDLQKPHPDIRKYVKECNVWIWGHAMLKPRPGIVMSDLLKQAQAPLGNKVYFANSDLSGISIFEEAFYHGHKAAKEMLANA